ncbi:hypothetical protein EKO23_07790 [Nocardioides guangzhouensis]|uniref:ATP-binding protein n=2 Tax=Nocardioides guangzhouensis TaxID=2497878 RepID=A0A4Q4ZHF0_9ACTN|nr:hypothetical protein EKO23_07790 [Nocardioides guangzhouensis]
MADFVVPRGEAMVVYGALGTGRYTAVRSYLETQPLPWHLIDLPPNQNATKINTWLYRETITADVLPLRDMQDDLVEALAEQPRIVVVRHAERLTAEAAGQLQWLHDRPDATWALILIGDSTVGTALQRDPLLAHAITGTVEVRPLADRDMLRVLQDLHPLFLNADPRLLQAIDNQVCKGNLDRWVRFLDRALWLADHQPTDPDQAPRLDKPLAQAVIAQLTKTPPTRK